ncbi:Dabb family protein [Runella slithyformis]|uniref:Stress responsive alpha-beta barrel domain-containing protein n=1 Tax=Runella slithyformis (strain ATCC 29530 / DSM 19594 / LMG 11500 / NCIMB 11436 / LSU 4) TaxID=761193 RepID=A0A7U3ZG45_RUNSL|nr:Dabb family protein [Runella slithyformis]AEI46596.1 Stress responsive alpha-beta barrel domain-containing protein [Runella slithyformis DSM 19594]
MQKLNRRSFLTVTAAAAIGTGTIPSIMAAPAQKQLVHHVFFWLKNPGSTADRDKLVEGIKTLAKIETIRKLHVGVLASTEKRDVVDTSWDVSELMFFDDTAGQKVYQDHPIHQEFIKNYSHLWSKVVVYDAMEA